MWRDATAGLLFAPATQRYARENNVYGNPPADAEAVIMIQSIAKRLEMKLKSDTNMSDFTGQLIVKEKELFQQLTKTLTHADFIKANLEEPFAERPDQQFQTGCVIL